MNLSSGGDGRIVKRRECELEDGRLVHDQRRFLCDCALLSERYNANRTCTKNEEMHRIFREIKK
jgi:hypothetical protein